ncbi:MAG: response regulator [Cyanobacteria bacterium P01_H01_bin.58]
MTVSSSAEAIALATAKQPDAILLDLMMPDMDGRATLKQFKVDATTQVIPVILVTAKAQQSNLQDFEDLDIAAIVAKPFRPLKLAAEITRILNWS